MPRGWGNSGSGGGGDSKIKDLSSTTGRWWTQVLKQITSVLDGEERKVKTVPLSYKKRVLFLGSSSTEGTVTKNAQKKYYGKLGEAKLKDKGYEFFHRGIGGDNTPGAIARFYKDVAPVNADFVFIALTIGNEGITGQATAAARMDKYRQFKSGILQLCHMIQQQGAVPIVLTQAPTRSYTTEIYAYSQKLNMELESMGIHCCDWGGVVDAMDGTGKPIDTIMFDNLHYNDAAHVEMCNAIPPTLFEKASLQDGGYLPFMEGYMSTNNLITQTPISYAPTDVTTFTASLRFRTTAIPNAQAIMSFNDTDRLALQTDGRITFQNATVNDEIVPIGFVKTGEWNTITVTYSPLAKELRVFVNGVFKKATASLTLNLTRWTLAGRNTSVSTLKNADIKDAVLYRTRLTAEKVQALHEGTVSQTSLEIYSPLHDKIVAANTNVINLAATNVNLQINETETALTAVNVAN